MIKYVIYCKGQKVIKYKTKAREIGIMKSMVHP